MTAKCASGSGRGLGLANWPVNELGTQTATKANFPTRCQPRKQVCQSPACNDVHLCGYQLPVPPPTQIPSRKDICRHIACRAKITIPRVPGDCNSQKTSFALYWLNLLQIVGTRNPWRDSCSSGPSDAVQDQGGGSAKRAPTAAPCTGTCFPIVLSLLTQLYRVLWMPKEECFLTCFMLGICDNLILFSFGTNVIQLIVWMLLLSM